MSSPWLRIHRRRHGLRLHGHRFSSRSIFRQIGPKIRLITRHTLQGLNKPLRQLVREGGQAGLDLIGTPDHVAERMGEVMAEVGGDGFLIKHPFHQISRRYIGEVTEGVVPALQRRDLVRTEYTKQTLRETLLEF